MKLYRVLPHDPDAAPNEPGGVFYVPGSTSGRIDNPSAYKVLYMSCEPEGAICELFGRFPIWKPAMFKNGSGAKYSLVTYFLADESPIFSLDDTAALTSLGVKNPSQIIARNRPFTQALALTIYKQAQYIGISWWNFYEPTWTSLGLWDTSSLGFADAVPLENQIRVVQKAATNIVRQFVV